MKQLVVLAALALGSGCLPAFTDCATHDDCEPGYGCSVEDNRCHPSCRNGLCDDDLVCRETVCMPPPKDGESTSSSSSSTGSSSGQFSSSTSMEPSSSTSMGGSSSSSSSGGLSSSSSAMVSSSTSMPMASSSSMAMSSSSSMMMSSSSAGMSSSSSAMGVPRDVCNGQDDDGNNQADEDGFHVLGSPVTLSSDSPPARVAVAASDRGFFVAFSAYCLAESVNTDVYVNHVGLDGNVLVGSGPCAAVKGVRVLRSQDARSRHPSLSSRSGTTAALAWSDGTDSSATLQVAEITLQPGNASPLGVVGPVSAGTVDTRFLESGGDVEMLGAVGSGASGHLTGLTRGESGGEQAFVQLVRPGSGGMLEVSANTLLGTSTGGEVALTALETGFVSAWLDFEDVQVRFLDANGQPTGMTRVHAPPSTVVPMELSMVALNTDRAVVAWHEVLLDNFTGLRRVALARVSGAAVGVTPLTAFDAPDARGWYGLAHADGELLVASLERGTQQPVLRRVNPDNGQVCDTLPLVTATDVGHLAVGVSGRYALVVYRTGGDGTGASNTVKAVLLEREQR